MLVLSRTSVTASLCFSCLTASLSTLPTALPTCFPNFVMAASASSVHGPLARLRTSTYFGCWMGQATESYEFCHFIATILDEFDLKVLQITTLSRKFWNFNLEKSLEKALDMSRRELRDLLRKRGTIEVPRQDFWRPIYLRKLLHERREMHLKAETNSQKELQSLIDSLCIN